MSVVCTPAAGLFPAVAARAAAAAAPQEGLPRPPAGWHGSLQLSSFSGGMGFATQPGQCNAALLAAPVADGLCGSTLAHAFL